VIRSLKPGRVRNRTTISSGRDDAPLRVALASKDVAVAHVPPELSANGEIASGYIR
jgi:hypothetical protein